jgi:hypothetical protein
MCGSYTASAVPWGLQTEAPGDSIEGRAVTEEEQKKAVAELITGMAPPDRSFVVPAAIDKTLQIIWRYQEPKPPSWHHATPKQAIEQLEEFADAFNRFREAADAISQDVYEPLWNWRGDHGLEWTATNAPVHAIRLLDEQYPHLELGARHVAEGLRQWLEESENKSHRGKKTDPDINQLAKSLGPLYHIVTGASPTRRNRTDYGHKPYGPFLEFVEDVFKLAGITAPATDYARKACKEFKASRASHGGNSSESAD